MLRVHTANRTEALTALLLDQVAQDQARAADPFTATEVLLPSAALRRHVTLAMADRQGVCTHVRFGFLAQWLWQQVARVVPAVAERSPFAPDALAWRIHQALADGVFLARHPRLQAYLAGGDALMRFELATRVAGLFDQYITFRGDWLADWQAQPQQPSLPVPGQTAPAAPPDAADTAWQAELWTRLTREMGADALHPTSTFEQLLAEGGAPAAQAAGLPACVHLFALPALPPLYLRLLQRIATAADVHLYVLNPCQQFWFDLVDRPRFIQQALKGQLDGLEMGHPLLTAWGQPAQQHLKALLAANGGSFDSEAWVQPDTTTLLGTLQAAVLAGHDLDAGSAPLAEGDRSLELHVCHSLSRELEVLQDRLLGLFAADRQLQPGRVLVLLPDLETAAPLIEAVFGTAPRERRLPFAITGRGRSQANVPARLLLAALDLVAGRAPATAVFELLQQPPVARRFGLDEAGLAQVHAWLLAGGFHAGLDARHLQAQGLPPEERHTLHAALSRLFLGHALPPGPHSGKLAAGLAGWLPAGEAEGQAALALGALWRFVENLQALQQAVQHSHGPTAWLKLLRQTLADLLLCNAEEQADLAELQQALYDLHTTMQRGGLGDTDTDTHADTDTVPLPVLRCALQAALDDPARGGVPTGSITFAAISSLRGLACDVLCVLGLNDGAFPASPSPAEFDLMARHPRAGDRDRRRDDRNLFLDLLLSARRSVYLSHTGRSVRDNSPQPPSVLVAELLDWLLNTVADPADGAAGRAAARARLVVEHPLQPFALQAFSPDSDPRLRSHHAGYAQALREALAAPDALTNNPPAQVANTLGDGDPDTAEDSPALQAFWQGQMPLLDAAFRRPTLAQLLRFFQHPSRAFLRERLGLVLPRGEAQLADEEAFEPERAGLVALRERLLPALMAGASDANIQALAQAGTELPPGPLGGLALDQELPALRAYAEQLGRWTEAATLPPVGLELAFDLDGETWVLQAGLADLRPHGLVRGRADALRAHDALSAWLHHLVLCAAAPPGIELRTLQLALDEPLVLGPVAAARHFLEDLMRLYRQGLQAPLHFYPRSAWVYARNGNTAAKALQSWLPGPFKTFAEAEDEAHRLLLRGQPDPWLHGEAAALAERIFGPVVLPPPDQAAGQGGVA